MKATSMTTPLLHAESLRADPRIEQAKALLLAALQDHSATLTDIRLPHPERQVEYADTIRAFANARGGELFYPYLGSGIGNGALVELVDGSIKFDMISGIGVHAFGHSDPALTLASIDAALGDTIMQGNLQQNGESTELVRQFIEMATANGAALHHCFLTTSGATANENALKLLFQARQPAGRILAFANCFAGRTLATSQVTDRAKNRVGLPTILPVDYVPYFDVHAPDSSLQRSLARLHEYLERYPGAHAGMILELIQGEGGYYAAPREFLRAICETLRAHNIPIFFDEIQTFGRTTQPFAFQHYQLDEFADVVTVGKMTQVCATLFRDEFIPKPGLISQTFTGSTSSIFAARSILERLKHGEFYGSDGRLMQIHRRFSQHFERIHSEHSGLLSGPWGIGGMVAFTPLNGSAGAGKKVLEQLFESGVIAFSAGADPTRIRMLPPFGVITDEQIDIVCTIIEKTLQQCA